MKFLIKTVYNELILEQGDMVCVQIFVESKTKANKYGDMRKSWGNFLRKFDPTTGDSKKRLCKKFAKCELYDITRYPEEWIINLKLLREEPQKLNVHIDDK